MNQNITNIWENMWYDKRGRVVIWQTPNIALIGWAVFTILSLFINGKTADIFQWLGIGSLLIWAGLEIFRGANYFRRLLGVAVLILDVLSIVKLF